jgi:hypothetical protein
MDPLYVLIHSPLLGPLTWSLVAEQLRRRGSEALALALNDAEGSGLPYWQQHAEAGADALGSVPGDRPIALVAHSGAGVLLPPIRQAAGRHIWAYIFVDAGLPRDGWTRLDEMAANAPELAGELRQHLASGGRFPEWTDEDLRDVIPDDHLRWGILAELRPRPLAFFEEPIPAFAGWPDAPCGYLRLSPAYEQPAEEARRRGWPCRGFAAGHFHTLVDPAAVAQALVDLVALLPRA